MRLVQHRACVVHSPPPEYGACCAGAGARLVGARPSVHPEAVAGLGIGTYSPAIAKR